MIDKPAGWTSHDVVARVRRIIGERRIGHTGTLDPFATGILVLLVGPAARLGQFLTGADKEYEAVFRLGFATDTGDLTGTRINHEAYVNSSTGFTAAEIQTAIASLRGEISQMPPMYSARKVGGRKLYEFARAGETIERKPSNVTIAEFEALRLNDLALEENGTVDLPVRVVCSSGTYVRVLAEDFGARLNIGAHVAELRRTRVGHFRLPLANTLERLEELVHSNSLGQAFFSPDETLSHLPFVQLSDFDVTRTRHGIDLQASDAVSSGWPDAQPVRLRDGAGKLIAVGRYSRAERIIHPAVVMGEG